MADPRKTIDFDQLLADRVTYDVVATNIIYSASQTYGSAQAGRAVTISANGKVDLAGDGEPVEGRLEQVFADSRATVQVGGFMELPSGTGAALTLGKKIVGDLIGATEGYIREAANAVTTEHAFARGRIVDASDSGAVVVAL